MGIERRSKMRAGIHFHGKLKRATWRNDKRVIVTIEIDEKTLILLKTMKTAGFVNPGSEVEVTIAND